MLTIELDSLDLVPGAYVVDLSIEQGAAEPVDYRLDMVFFEMISECTDIGISRIAHTFSWEDE